MRSSRFTANVSLVSFTLEQLECRARLVPRCVSAGFPSQPESCCQGGAKGQRQLKPGLFWVGFLLKKDLAYLSVDGFNMAVQASHWTRLGCDCLYEATLKLHYDTTVFIIVVFFIF